MENSLYMHIENQISEVISFVFYYGYKLNGRSLISFLVWQVYIEPSSPFFSHTILKTSAKYKRIQRSILAGYNDAVRYLFRIHLNLDGSVVTSCFNTDL